MISLVSAATRISAMEFTTALLRPALVTTCKTCNRTLLPFVLLPVSSLPPDQSIPTDWDYSRVVRIWIYHPTCRHHWNRGCCLGHRFRHSTFHAMNVLNKTNSAHRAPARPEPVPHLLLTLQRLFWQPSHPILALSPAPLEAPPCTAPSLQQVLAHLPFHPAHTPPKW